jgi:hypothetical protein
MAGVVDLASRLYAGTAARNSYLYRMRYLPVFILLLFAAPLAAQRTFHAGLLAGINGCQVHGDSYSGFNQVGFVGGAFVSTDPSKRWYGQMELQYSRKGSRKVANPEKGDYDYFELRMNYVEMPFLLILGRVREWDDFGEITPRDFRRWESALIVGLGVNFGQHWYVDFRYTNSLFPVKRFAVPLYYPRYISNLFNKGMYNNVLGLSFCYRFSGKGGE